MSLLAFLVALLPSLLALGTGAMLARFADLKPAATGPLLRYALVPALLFTLLLGPIGPRTFVLVALVGVATALAGHFAVRLTPRLLGRKLSPAAARIGLIGFTLPTLALSLGGRPAMLMALAVLFVAVTTTLVFAEHGEGGFGILIRQPWLYAALAALLVRLLQLPSADVLAVLAPLAQASWVVLLVQVGTTLLPLPPWRDGSVWLSVGVRLVVGLGLALLAVALLPLPAGVDRAVLLFGIAPAAASEQALMLPGESARDERQVTALSTYVGVVAVVLWWALRG